MPIGKPFAKGEDERRGQGGAREGAGRPSDGLRTKAREIGDPVQILQFYWDVANGKNMEQVVTDAGESIATPAQVKDRLRAGELFLERAVGKVAQELDVTSHDSDRPSTETLVETLRVLREELDAARKGIGVEAAK